MDAALRQVQGRISFATRGPQFLYITARIEAWLEAQACGDGLLTVFIRHTSASLTIQENADPAVLGDLQSALDSLAPRTRAWRHSTEGPDDMPAHIRSMLTATSLPIPVQDGAMVLGKWQALYIAEHRDGPQQREVVLHFIGSSSAHPC